MIVTHALHYGLKGKLPVYLFSLVFLKKWQLPVFYYISLSVFYYRLPFAELLMS